MDRLINFINLITGRAYKELKVEWEKQNADLDKVTGERNKWKKKFEELTAEYEREKDQFNMRLARQEKKYEKDVSAYTERMEGMFEALRMDNETLEKELEDTGSKLVLKEAQRRKAVGEKTAVTKKLNKSEKEVESLKNEITKLEEQVAFLKRHRRAPDIEEIKDYTEGRKRKTCKKTS